MGLQLSYLLKSVKWVNENTYVADMIKVIASVSLFRAFRHANPGLISSDGSKFFLYVPLSFFSAADWSYKVCNNDNKTGFWYYFTIYATAIATDVLYDKLLRTSA